MTTEKRDLRFIEKAWGSDRNMTQRLRVLYVRLHCLIGTQQFVFCYLDYRHWRQCEVRRLWVLNAPKKEVLRYIRSGLWHKLLQPDAGPSEEKIWPDLFLSDEEVRGLDVSARGDGVQALLHLPVKVGWVVDKSKFNMGPAVSDQHSNYDSLPTSIEEAKRYRDGHSRRTRNFRSKLPRRC